MPYNSKESFQSHFYEKNVVHLKSDASVLEAAQMMREHHVGDVVIVDKKNEGLVPIGILTDRDIVMETTSKNLLPEGVQVSTIMSKKIITGKEADGLGDWVKTIREHGVARLPIVNDSGLLIGILSSKKLLQFFARELCDLSLLSEHQKERELSKH